ncbi:phosphotransferase [Micromonospora deserti]|uniref:phosphotransferase n=1 Tax=Micromonospora deserti TaxID=2070366 RepID=UPI0018F3C22F|nr:phosphotransferase [Micromonospora deserti]
MTELVKHVDDQDRVLGVVGRGAAVHHGWLHRISTSIWRDEDGRFLVYRRAERLPRFPGYYEVTFGGAVNVGESYQAAAARELAEELGVHVPVRFVLKFLCHGERGSYWLGIHEAVITGPVDPDPREVAWLGPILRNTTGARMDRHAATRRLKQRCRARGRRPAGRGQPRSRTRLTRGDVGDHLAILADVEEVKVVVAHHERATLRVGDVFLKIDADQTRTDVEVEAMAMAPIPTPEVLWRKPPVLALAALPGTALGRLGEPSTASSSAWAAAGAAARMLHDAPLPPWPGRRLDEIASDLDGECEWLVTNGVLPTDVVTRNRRVAEAALRPWTPVFTHGDLQITHVFVHGDEITGVIDWSEACQGDALYDLAILTLGHEEHLGDVVAGYGTDVDLDVIRAWWSLRSLLAIRWLVEHGFDPSSPGCEFDVLRSRV